MRDFICIMMLLVRALASSAQMSEQPNNLSSGNGWGYYGYYQDGRVLFSESYKFGEAFENNGKTYQRLLITRSFFDNGTPGDVCYDCPQPFYPIHYDVPKGEIGVRQSEGRILVDKQDYLSLLSDTSYWRWEGSVDFLPYEKTLDGELVIYDFTKSVGDRYHSVEGYDDIIVVNVKTIVTRDGIERRMQTLSNGLVVIEGIGCINSPGMWLFYLNPSISPCTKGEMRSFQNGPDKDDVVYSWVDYETMSISNPTLHLLAFPPDCYDLQGRRLTHQPRPGIYIRDGKKVVVK